MWYLTIHSYVKKREESRSILNDHLAWMFKQHQAGCVLFSGPTSDRTHAVIVLKASSMEEAKEIMDEEPFVRQAYRTYEMYEWDVHQILGVGAFTRESRETVDHDAKILMNTESDTDPI